MKLIIAIYENYVRKSERSNRNQTEASACPRTKDRQRKIKFCTFLCAAVLFSGCASKSLRFNELKEGQWESRVDVLDKKNNKSSSFSVTFKATPLENTRLDVLTPTGMYVGSVLVNADQFQALLANAKKFYRGEANMRSMQKVLNLPLDPIWLNHFLFDIPPDQWSCQFDRQKYLEKCTNDEQAIEAIWSQRKDSRKMIQIVSVDFEVKVFLTRYRPTIEGRDKAFSLNPPKGFRIFRIR